MFWKTSEELNSPTVEVTENEDIIEEEDDDVLTERRAIGDYMKQGQNYQERVVAVEGLRKVFKTNEAKEDKKKGCRKRTGDVEAENEGNKTFFLNSFDYYSQITVSSSFVLDAWKQYAILVDFVNMLCKNTTCNEGPFS